MNRQRLDSPLVYVGAHNVYYVKLNLSELRVPPTLFPLWRQCYFYCSLLAIAPLPTQLSHLVRRG